MKLIKQRLIDAMEAYFGDDRKRIEHAKKVTGYVEQLIDERNDYDVCVAAGVLHDIGIHQAEQKYGSNSGKYQEMEGPGVARPILEGLGFPQRQIDEICEIIAHHHSPGKVTTANFQALYEADWLVNLKDDYGLEDREKLARIIDRVFQTPRGRALAVKTYLTDSD
ncbi:MAG: HD domain-containing protein [Chloroflexi bacterium]|nr:HD domain-containing protein [Chloroflexota bacterium]